MSGVGAVGAASRRVVIAGGEVFDGTGAPAAPGDVLVEGGRIVEVGTGLDGDVRVDASGHTVLPGLFDCHVHLTSSGVDLLQRLNRPFSYQFYEAARNLRATLEAGVTTVRDAGGSDLGIQRAVADGLIAGPRMLIAVNVIGQTGGHTDGWLPSSLDAPMGVPHPGRPAAIADGPDELRKTVRTLIRAGADVIKICTTGGVLSPGDDPTHSQFSPAELAVVVAEAAAAGRAVMAHAQGAGGIKNALVAGVRSIEHGIFLDDEAIELMLTRQAWLVPTLVAPLAVIEAAEAGAALPESVVAKAVDVAAAHQESFRRAVAAGVRVAMGTDSGVGPHGRNLQELAVMQRCGMSAEQALHAATGSAAQLCGLADRVGRLAPGLAADLVLVRGGVDDLADLGARIAQVWQAGLPVVDRTVLAP